MDRGEGGGRDACGKGLLYPLQIFGNYGYSVAENLSLGAIKARGLWAWEYDYFEALALTVAGVCVWRWFAHKPGQKPFWPNVLVLGTLGVGSYAMFRNMPVFCLLMIPMAAELLLNTLGPKKLAAGSVKIAALVLCAFSLGAVALEAQQRHATFGLGLKPGTTGPADFLLANNIAGPTFNDFDIGSYLTFYRVQPGGGDRVFVDGRPEAYPPGFFQTVYIPMLSDDNVWHRMDEQYHFNAIVISMQDGFPPIEKFISTRVRDGDWAPVYTDPYSLIFVRRNEKNAEVIKKHLIPREAFR